MKRFNTIWNNLLLLQLFLSAVQLTVSNEELADIETLVETFADNLFFDSILKSADSGNVFLSPWSIYSALSLTLAATGGNTNTQILKGLGLTNSQQLQEQLAQWQRNQLSNGMGNSKVVLSLANRAFVDQNVSLKADFLDLLEKTYHAELAKEPFQQNPDQAREAINKWVEEQTHNKIRDLLQRDQVTSLTRLILVNAVYFNGQWLEKFDPHSTESATFQCLEPNMQKNVKMMKRVGQLRYAELEDLEAKLLWMPFSDNRTQVAIVLPNAKDGLAALEQRLRSDNGRLFDILRNSRGDEREVTLRIPRMKVSSDMDLKNILSETFHMKDLFDFAKADFTPMTSVRDLAVSSVVHKAVFEMDEGGATAAAATSVGIHTMMAPMPVEHVEIKVDHPFHVLILGEQLTPLFMGRIICLEE